MKKDNLINLLHHSVREIGRERERERERVEHMIRRGKNTNPSHFRFSVTDKKNTTINITKLQYTSDHKHAGTHTHTHTHSYTAP